MALKFHTSVVKGLKLKVRKFWRLIPVFVKVTGEKLVRGAFLFPPLSILNRVKALGMNIQSKYESANIKCRLKFL